MEINGLQIPAAFVRDVRAGRFDRPRGVWELRERRNFWGELLETDIKEVCEDEEGLEVETQNLTLYFTPREEDSRAELAQRDTARGELAPIWDFSRVVCFAMAGDGAPICFDFRESLDEPSVIWWADAFWQRVAPSYEEFTALFDIP